MKTPYHPCLYDDAIFGREINDALVHGQATMQ